jgi:hypothetical protein
MGGTLPTLTDCDCQSFDCDPCFTRVAASFDAPSTPPRDWSLQEREAERVRAAAARQDIGVETVQRPEVNDACFDYWSAKKRNNGKWVGHAQVCRLLGLGLSLREVAAALGDDLGTITRLFFQSPHVPTRALLAAEELLRDGAETYEQVAEATGLSKHQARRFAKKAGLGTRGGRRYSDDQRAEVKRLRDEGLSLAQIAERLPWLPNKNAAYGLVRARTRGVA